MTETRGPTSHLPNPHDRFFRHFLADPERARAFIRHVLPPAVREALDLTALQQEDVSFVDPDLRARQGDVLFRVALRSGEPAYVYVLFEHKSYPDRWVAWQLLRYMVRIWERAWQAERVLPVIVPVVVYHGVAAWREPVRFEALVAAPEALGMYVPRFGCRLYDLSGVEDAALWREVVIGAWLALMKYIQRPELEGKLEAIFGALRRWLEVAGAESGVEAVVTVLRYLAEAREGLDEAVVRQAMARALPEGGIPMATLAQKWMQQGLEQGLEQGRREGLVQAIVALLRARLGPGEAWLQEVAERLEAVEDLETLQELLILAARVESREAFDEALAARRG